MRYLLFFVLAGCTSSPAPKPDAYVDPFGNACVPDGYEPLSTCLATDREGGWCIDNVCRRGCINGACPSGQQPMPVYNDCYCE